jgi:sugar phosphate isomerase/epimerase
MRFGICTGPERLEEAVRAGADYIECTVVKLMEHSEEERAAFADELSNSPIHCEALAVLFPGRRIPLTGEEFNPQAVEEYAETVFTVLKKICRPAVVVFGSGGARNCPEGFDRARAMEQITETGRILSHAAAKNDITVALEPLNRKECNTINTVTEAVSIAKKINHPNFKVTADLYHMLTEDEPPEAIYNSEGWIAHTHIATKNGRLYPQTADGDVFAPYFKALREIGYTGRMSIEAGENGSLHDSFAAMRGW